MSGLVYVSIQYKQGQKFENDNGYVLPTYVFVSITAGVYTLKVPSYCLDSSNKISNSLMHSLYPQFASYDFEAGNV